MRTEILTDWPAVAGLGGEWNRLLRASRGDTLFLTWEWIDTWRRGLAPGVRPFVVTARDGDGIPLGVAPFYVARLRLLRSIPLRTLRVLGDFHSGGEYGDWIMARQDEAGVSSALALAVASARRQWDCVWMPNLAAWTGATQRVAAACARAGLRVQERPIEFSAAALPRAYPEYWEALSANSRSTLRRQNRKLEECGAEFVRCTSAEDIPAYLAALASLNEKRWRATGVPGTFTRKPMELAFYQRFVPIALEKGWLRLFAVRQGGQFLAVQIGYAYGGSFLQLQEGFDPAGPPGLGNALRARVIQACIEEGLSTYDFLGEHTEHKRRWLAVVRPGADVLVTNRRPGSAALHALGVWPTGRYLRPEPMAPSGVVSGGAS